MKSCRRFRQTLKFPSETGKNTSMLNKISTVQSAYEMFFLYLNDQRDYFKIFFNFIKIVS